MDTIKNINLIAKIKNETAAMQAQIERAENSGPQLHRLDVEIMLTQTRRIYEYLQQLETENAPSTFYTSASQQFKKTEEFEEPEAEIAQPEPEIAVIDEAVVEAPQQTEVETPEIIETVKPNAVQQADGLWEQTPEQSANIELETNFEPLVISDPEPKPTHSHFEVEKPPIQRTTLDLFGESIDSLGDKLAAGRGNTIASRLERSKINDLRQAIGINEKFLFINELFEGNITFYNKAIDELNSFHSLNGAKTYLIELSVLHHWSTSSPAAEKITQLIERKFEQES